MMLVICLLEAPVSAQEIVSFSVPTSLCASSIDTVTFGFSTDNDIVVSNSSTPCSVTGYQIIGYGVTSISNNSFTITAPQHINQDSTVLYTYRILSSCGLLDSSVSLTFHPTYHYNYDTAVCERITWGGSTYDFNTTVTQTTHTRYGCDSIERLLITIHPGYHLQRTDTVSVYDLPYSFLGHTFRAPVTDTLITTTTTFGCDSNVSFTLIVNYNTSTVVRMNLCEDELPYFWNGLSLTGECITTLVLPSIYGADSTVTLILSVRPSYHVTVDTTICDNHPYLLGNRQLNSSGFYQDTLSTVDGCDSLVSLNLTANPHHDLEIFETSCYGQGYTLGGIDYNQSGTYHLDTTNHYGCDSTVTLHLQIADNNLKAQIRAIPPMVTSANPEFTLYDYSANNASRLWLLDGHQRSETPLTYSFPTGIDSLPVTLVVFGPEGCSDTASTTIFIDRSALFTPNAFTPGREPNSTWQPIFYEIESLEIWLYNRQGLLVAHLEGTDAKWDGTRNGEPCPQGAYAYNLQYRTKASPHQLRLLTGTVLLLR